MTIVKPSSKKQRSKIGNNNKLMKSADCSDVFSDIHMIKKKSKNIVNESDESYEEEQDEEFEFQEPKGDLQDLFAAIQKRLKKKIIDQKRAIENELKKTILRTVDEMNQKNELVKSQIENKLLDMKMELEKIQRDRENHLKIIKSDYENFQIVIKKSIDKIDYGEKRINEIRENFLSEIISFNRDFSFPKEKIEELFNSVLKESKNKFSETLTSKYY